MNKRSVHAALILLVLGAFCSAQGQPARLLLKVDQSSSGPFGGEKGASCLLLYSDGRLLSVSLSTSAVDLMDEHGKITRPEKRNSREYRFPKRDSWQVGELVDFLQSKPILRLKSYFPPPHRPTDFVEVSTVQVFLPGGKSKQIGTREYYVASLVEKTKYPTALVILMDRISTLEDLVGDKGTPADAPPDCKFEHRSEPGSMSQ